MVASIQFNYLAQTTAAGTFVAQSVGYVQGVFLDDPAIRYQMAGGVLAQTETLPMWGGVAISETVIPNTGTNPPDASQGGLISRATTISTTGATGAITGFSVFNQAYGMTITPQSTVPLAASGMQVNFFRLGSNARIVVACSSALASLEGSPITQQVSWDFVNQQLIPYQAAYNSASVQSATYTSSTGILAVTFASAPAGTSPTVGAYFSISGFTTSAGSASNVNGDFPLVSSSGSGTVLNLQAVAGLGTITITSATGTLAAGGGALPCKVIEILVGNSMAVSYSTSTGYATWNYSGNVAVIQI